MSIQLKEEQQLIEVIGNRVIRQLELIEQSINFHDSSSAEFVLDQTKTFVFQSELTYQSFVLLDGFLTQVRLLLNQLIQDLVLLVASGDQYGAVICARSEIQTLIDQSQLLGAA